MPTPSQLAVIDQLSESHQRLERLLDDIGRDALQRPSACSQWSVGQVVAHLGSGAQIALGALRSGVAGSIEPLADEAMQRRWADYDALTDGAAVGRSLTANAALIEAFEALTVTQLTEVRVPFFAGPVPVATFAAFRLSEHAVHTWDIEVTRHDAAELDIASSAIILENVIKPLIGRLERPSNAAEKRIDVHLVDVGRTLRLELSDPVALLDEASPAIADGSLMISTPAFVRLVYGRFDPQSALKTATVTGAVSLDQLRKIFPGF